MKLASLKDLYVNKLKDVYDAEQQIIRALPKMIKATSSGDLKKALEEHLEITEGQVKRLDQIFRDMGQQVQRKTCDGMKGLIEEGQQLMEEDAEPAVREAGLIAAAQAVEHYEIAAYGSLNTWASQLQEESAADLLDETLEEEKEADEKLTEIAENLVNPQAAQEQGEQKTP